MSKIFEVLSKDNLLDITDISDHAVPIAAPNAPSAAVTAPEPPVAADVPIAHFPPRDSERRVSLRISALAPLFPFSEKVNHAAAEQYRIVRTKILHHPKRPRVVTISSACAGDGKTITAINIAASLSLKANTSVLLVDTDLRRPKVAELLGIPSRPGVTEVLAAHACLADALVRCEEFPNLFILPAGERIQSATELLDSDPWHKLVAELRSRFSNVILDATPAGVVADYDLLQQASDGVILVIRPDHTDRKACLDALQLVPKEKLLGVVINCAEQWPFSSAPGYYKYYGTESSSAK
jgi:capsular exopolysaccharide synthesis family protein